MKKTDRDNEDNKSYTNEMKETDYQMFLQIADEKKSTFNMFKINLAFLFLILFLVLYFILGPNYFLTWKSTSKPNTKINIGLFKFTVIDDDDNNNNSSSDSFNYYDKCKSKQSSSPSSNSSDLLNEESLTDHCAVFYQLYIMGIIVSLLSYHTVSHHS